MEQSRQFKSIKNMCLKKHNEREMRELKIIGKFFQNYTFFKKLSDSNDEDAYYGIMRYIKLQAYQKDQTIIEEGDQGDRFYVIIIGKVDILKAY